jgi:transcription elongation factor/antiterminator RfaH
MLSNDKFIRELRWYVVQTKPREEERADYNLQAWKVETFAPKIKTRRLNEFSHRSTSISKSLFPGYIFARFDASTSLHDINATRGVQRVVRFGDALVPVDDQVIDMIRSRTRDGFVQVGEKILPGTKFTICDGPLNGLSGVLERKMKDNERVMLLLQCVNYQGHFMIDSDRLKMAS